MLWFIAGMLIMLVGLLSIIKAAIPSLMLLVLLVIVIALTIRAAMRGGQAEERSVDTKSGSFAGLRIAKTAFLVGLVLLLPGILVCLATKDGYRSLTGGKVYGSPSGLGVMLVVFGGMVLVFAFVRTVCALWGGYRKKIVGISAVIGVFGLAVLLALSFKNAPENRRLLSSIEETAVGETYTDIQNIQYRIKEGNKYARTEVEFLDGERLYMKRGTFMMHVTGKFSWEWQPTNLEIDAEFPYRFRIFPISGRVYLCTNGHWYRVYLDQSGENVMSIAFY